MRHRQADYPIQDTILNRWSPRSFQQKEIPEQTLFSLFEAARWAPSANNRQPWRYILARTKEDRERFYSFISEGNLRWCKNAPAMALIMSKTTTDEGKLNRSHAFDAGSSWALLALEAVNKGLIVHAIGGFDREAAKVALNIPEEYELHAIIIIGYQDTKEKLPEDLQLRENPTPRKTITEWLFEGTFGKTTN